MVLLLLHSPFLCTFVQFVCSVPSYSDRPLGGAVADRRTVLTLRNIYIIYLSITKWRTSAGCGPSGGSVRTPDEKST